LLWGQILAQLDYRCKKLKNLYGFIDPEVIAAVKVQAEGIDKGVSMKLLLMGSLIFLNTLAMAVEPSRLTFEEWSPKLSHKKTSGAGMKSELSFFAVGDGKKAELFSLVYKVVPHSQIEAHHHPDPRSCFVLKGEWHIGYGDVFSEKKLKKLPEGSHYTEPANINHFAATKDSEAIVECTGMGPTGTTFAHEED
jgi:quercetin dioxygenase-like cupin family protein